MVTNFGTLALVTNFGANRPDDREGNLVTNFGANRDRDGTNSPGDREAGPLGKRSTLLAGSMGINWGGGGGWVRSCRPGGVSIAAGRYVNANVMSNIT